MSKARRKKNEETKRRFEAIKDLMSTFAMSTVAVVAAVTLIPASPKAQVTKVVALSEEIVYQVTVTDEDNALDLSTLFVVLENQLEFYEQPISLGENSGYFDSLNNNTEYRLSVYGNKGFGQERLDTIKITTGEKIGGTILSVTPVSTEFSTNYIVDISINDPNLIYETYNLYYGYSFEPGTDLQYNLIPFTLLETSIELFDIYTLDTFHIYIEGVTSNGIEEKLDEISVTPPFDLYTSVYTEYIDTEEIGFYIYNNYHLENISYEMKIYKDDILLRTDQIDLSKDGIENYMFIIDNLLPSTTYYFEFIVTYTNPQTLRLENKVVEIGEITTLENFLQNNTTDIFINREVTK